MTDVRHAEIGMGKFVERDHVLCETQHKNNCPKSFKEIDLRRVMSGCKRVTSSFEAVHCLRWS